MFAKKDTARRGVLVGSRRSSCDSSAKPYLSRSGGKP